MTSFKKVGLAMVAMMSIFCVSPFSSLYAEQALQLSIAGEPDSLDPRTSNNINASFVISMLFQGLVELDSTGAAIPCLAESIDLSKDRKTYTFHIRQGVRWSDGTPLTAHDVEYSWKSCLDPKLPTPCANLLYPIKNAQPAKKGEKPLSEVAIRALDDTSLIVELDQPVPFFLDLVAAPIFYPIPKHQVEKDPKWGSHATLASNGPFQLVSWSPGSKIGVKKNSAYWNASAVKIEKIQVSIIPDENTALTLFKQGKLDWIGGDFSPLPLDALPTLRKEATLEQSSYGGTRYCALNTQTFPLNNKNLRKALSIAVDRQALIDNITFCNDEPAANMIASYFKDRQRINLFPDGDVETARTYLKKALEELKLKPEELDITLKFENAEITKRLAQAMQQQWKKVLGIHVKLDGSELKTFVSSLRGRNFQMGLIYWMLHYNNPMDIMDRYRSKDELKNYPGWENGEYTRLLDEYFTEPNASKRQALLQRAESIFISDMPVIPLFHFSRPYLTRSTLKNIQVTPIGDVSFAEAYIESGK